MILESAVGYTFASGAVGRRLVPACITLSCLALLLVAAWLHPMPGGLGTHTELGLAPCGFETAWGIPCVTCGMTTAFAFAAHGQLLWAVWAQPAGAALAVLTAVACLLGGYAAVRGLSLGPIFQYLWRPVVAWSAAALFLGAWAYKIALCRGLL